MDVQHYPESRLEIRPMYLLCIVERQMRHFLPRRHLFHHVVVISCFLGTLKVQLLRVETVRLLLLGGVGAPTKGETW